MFPGITLDMRLGYKPMKIPDTIVVDCYDNKKFTKSEVSILTDLATIYDIQLFSIHQNYATFHDADEENIVKRDYKVGKFKK